MDGKLGLGKEFTFPTVIPNFLVHEVIGVRKEKERLTAVAAGCGPEPFLPFVNTFLLGLLWPNKNCRPLAQEPHEALQKH